ncbi:hypothetical protein [Corynebacterium sp.]|uniref:hypothetical protein n=1 Tax=Corynebacterium sp. TaxID=1720 RepID=UPI0026DDB34C|nr:hypothetical protein [Corynebacterium sp.]MDO5032098.1 hypothetical protein [Corynebacterium sp.]
MIRSRLIALSVAGAVALGGLSAPAALAQDAPAATATAETGDSGNSNNNGDADNNGATGGNSGDSDNSGNTGGSSENNGAQKPTTPWLSIVEGSSQGVPGVIFAVIFGIVGLGIAAYQAFGDYLPKLG